ncbi:MAG: DUF3540 domain-containing protein [Helicobacteraceae bacterium]|nr:DUF3540 domain-containing protein [Helicobacteraceae bacterium]
MTMIMTNSIYDNKFSAIVTALENGQYSCLYNETAYTAQKALTCLITPQVGDKVILFKTDESNIFITDILDRTLPSTLEIDTQSAISINAHSITLNAQNSINSFANEANVVISKVSFLTKVATLKANTLNVISTMYQGAIDHFNMKNESVTQNINGHQELQCNSSRKITKESDIYYTKDSILVADGQVKIDADQINMG